MQEIPKMEITYSEFTKVIKKVETMTNPTPSYIPSNEEIDKLFQFTKTIRTSDNSDVYNKKTGRISEYENKQVFVVPSEIGSFVVNEKDFFTYLIYISETSDIDEETTEIAVNQKNLNKYLRENLIIK